MSYTNLPTDLLRSFLTVIEEGGFTRAGELLGRTQPAISLQMRRLEELVGKKLIDQAGRQIRLTEAGEMLALYARQILRLNDEFIATFDGGAVGGPLRIGLPLDYGASFLQRVATDFATEHPDVEMSIQYELSCDIREKVGRDEIDVAIALTDRPTGRYMASSWVEQPVWASSARSRVHTQVPVPLVSHPEGCEYRKRMIQALNSVGRAWRFAFVSPAIESLQEAVLTGFGVSALTGPTLTDGMRLLDAQEGFPPMSELRVGLFYKHNHLSDAALGLTHALIEALDARNGKADDAAQPSRAAR